jgi:hypothetical protein
MGLAKPAAVVTCESETFGNFFNNSFSSGDFAKTVGPAGFRPPADDV